MVSTKVSLAALDKLKERYKDKIRNHIQPQVRRQLEMVSQKNRIQAEAIISDLENYALKKYPNILGVYPKCDNKRSSSTMNGLSIGLSMKDAELSAKFRVAVKALNEEQVKEMGRLERWYTNCLKRVSEGEGMVEFPVVGFEEVSDEHNYDNCH